MAKFITLTDTDNNEVDIATWKIVSYKRINNVGFWGWLSAGPMGQSTQVELKNSLYLFVKDSTAKIRNLIKEA